MLENRLLEFLSRPIRRCTNLVRTPLNYSLVAGKSTVPAADSPWHQRARAVTSLVAQRRHGIRASDEHGMRGDRDHRDDERDE